MSRDSIMANPWVTLERKSHLFLTYFNQYRVKRSQKTHAHKHALHNLIPYFNFNFR